MRNWKRVSFEFRIWDLKKKKVNHGMTRKPTDKEK